MSRTSTAGSSQSTPRRLFVAFILALAASGLYIASSSPDGLERVAADLGFEDHAVTVVPAPVPDYGESSPLRWLAGLSGAVAVGLLAYAAGVVSRRR